MFPSDGIDYKTPQICIFIQVVPNILDIFSVILVDVSLRSQNLLINLLLKKHSYCEIKPHTF